MSLLSTWAVLTLGFSACAPTEALDTAEGAVFSVVQNTLVPPAHVVETGNGAPLIRYDRSLSGGAHTWESRSGGWQITHALAVRAGDPKATAKMLEQIRYSLEGENCLSANGGYPAQHERHMTGVYTILKGSEFWNGTLTAAERHKITLLMKATLVASAYTTADASYDQTITTLDGDKNLNRGWNPNFREGMFGGLLHATVFFGGVDAVEAMLDSYDHAAFVSELAEAGLANTHETFTWAEDHPDSGAPTGERIERCVRDYRYNGQSLPNPLQQLYDLTVLHLWWNRELWPQWR